MELPRPTFEFSWVYTVCYDGRNKIPLWIFERLTQDTLKDNYKRKNLSFVIDHDVYWLHQSKSSDYSSSGFEKGHMAPAMNHEFSERSMKDTFFYSNACPQVKSSNAGSWKMLESRTKNCLEQYATVDVITGPLFLPREKNEKFYVRYQVIGENKVSVPTHFFKVLYLRNENGVLKDLKAYVLPNEKITVSNRTMTIDDFSEYEVSIETIESISGLILRKEVIEP